MQEPQINAVKTESELIAEPTWSYTPRTRYTHTHTYNPDNSEGLMSDAVMLLTGSFCGAPGCSPG